MFPEYVWGRIKCEQIKSLFVYAAGQPVSAVFDVLFVFMFMGISKLRPSRGRIVVVSI